MIKRWIWKKLIKSINNNPAVALLGARQVGKTTLAKEIAKASKSIYLDLEDERSLVKLTDTRSFLEDHKDKLIILDEIRHTPEIFRDLRGIIDENRENGKNAAQFLLLGSASMDLLRQPSESLAGRISYVDMTGINVLELANTNYQVKKLWFYGGFFGSFLRSDQSLSMEWIEDLIRTYLERDVPAMGFNVSSVTLRRLWTMLAHLQGETINVNKLATNLEATTTNINSYINILIDLLLVRKIMPMTANVKKRLVKSPRYFVRDSGILHRLLSISSYDMLLGNPILGKSWEGFVVENIHSVLPKLAQSYFYRTASGAEIDLVLKMPNEEIWAIEIKFGSAPKISKYFHQVCDDIAATHKFIVYGGDDDFSIGNNTRMISLQKIMEKIACL